MALKAPLSVTTLPFTTGQVQALQAAHASRWYKVGVFERAQDDGTVGCVLLGETHAKPSELAAQIGKDAVGEFGWHAFESSPDATVGDRIYAPIHSVAGRALNRVFGKRPSTILNQVDVVFDNVLSNKSLLRQIAEKYGLEDMSAEERATIKIPFRAESGAHKREMILTGEQVFEHLHKEDGAPETRALDLEHGFQPTFYDQVSSVSFSTAVWLSLLPTALFLFSPPAAKALATYVAMPLWAINIGGMLLSRFIPYTSPWKRRIDIMSAYNLHSRNANMARNIDAALKRGSDGDIMLAVFGRAHYAGIAAYLQHRHDFTEVELRNSEM